MRNVILLGATGSIGTQTLDIIRENDDLSLVAFSFGNNIKRAIEIIHEFHPKYVCGINYEDVLKIKEFFPEIKIAFGDTGLQEMASYKVENPVFINSLVGIAGLIPTVAAINSKKNVYLANKETLVVAGDLVNSLAKDKGVKIIPIDSEHSAIYQLIQGTSKEDIKRLIITASGGSLRDLDLSKVKDATVSDVLNHPNWKMGPKITVDCATMMNKGFEIIEARYLFNVDIEKITSIIHKESIIHSMVEFNDNSVYAQMSIPDMRLPIQYALYNPFHKSNDLIKPLDLVEVGSLHFEKVSNDKYPLLNVCLEAFKKGKLYLTILNASNEAAVKLFLEEKIKFSDIEKLIVEAINDKKYEGFNNNEKTISKIVALHRFVYDDIYNRF